MYFKMYHLIWNNIVFVEIFNLWPTLLFSWEKILYGSIILIVSGALMIGSSFVPIDPKNKRKAFLEKAKKTMFYWGKVCVVVGGFGAVLSLVFVVDNKLELWIVSSEDKIEALINKLDNEIPLNDEDIELFERIRTQWYNETKKKRV